MNRIRSTKVKLPVLSELHQQRLRLHEQIREYRRVRHRAYRDKLQRLFRKDSGDPTDAAAEKTNHKEGDDHESQ